MGGSEVMDGCRPPSREASVGKRCRVPDAGSEEIDMVLEVPDIVLMRIDITLMKTDKALEQVDIMLMQSFMALAKI